MTTPKTPPTTPGTTAFTPPPDPAASREVCPHHWEQRASHAPYVGNCHLLREAITSAILRREDGSLRTAGKTELDSDEIEKVRRTTCLLVAGLACPPGAQRPAPAAPPADDTGCAYAPAPAPGQLRRVTKDVILRTLAFYWKHGRASAAAPDSEYHYVPLASGPKGAWARLPGSDAGGAVLGGQGEEGGAGRSPANKPGSGFPDAPGSVDALE
ncbi:MAG: hypothetical protein V4723_07295 [Pseudomonadota bacterium]